MGKQELFKRDLERVTQYFPDLRHAPSKSHYFTLEGDLPLIDANGHLVNIFEVVVKYTPSYPFGFAELFELGEEVPKDIDWHKGKDDKCCVCAPPETAIQKKKKNSAIHFIREYAIPFLANFQHRKVYGRYPNGVYEHFDQGIIQWYQEQFPNNTITEIIELLEKLIGHSIRTERNSLCLCGSHKKYKRCHKHLVEDLNLIPTMEVRKHLKMLEKAQ